MTAQLMQTPDDTRGPPWLIQTTLYNLLEVVMDELKTGEENMASAIVRDIIDSHPVHKRRVQPY